MRASATTLETEISPREMTALLGLLRQSNFTGRHLEIGTAAGGTLKEMILSYPGDKRPPFVVVDPMTYFPDQLAKVKSNLAAAGIDPAEVEFRVGKSWPAFHDARNRNETYSFMFIDGSHKLAHVTEDLAWLQLLETGGIACFHDYKPQFPGVTMAVDRFLAKNANFEKIAHEESLFAIRKMAQGGSGISAWDLLRAKLISLYLQLAHSARKRLAKSQ